MSASKLQLKYWESLKGKTPWNKGKKETRQEVLQKQSNSHKGKTTWNKGLTKEDPRVQKYMHKKGEFKQSEAAKEKLRKIHKGKHHSPRTEFKKGQIAPMKGKKLSNERKKQMSIIMKGKFIGEKSPLWKGGISKLNNLIRCMPEYKQWKSDVLKRDNWTCQTCGKRGCILEVHHSYELFKIIKEEKINTIIDARNCNKIWDINNGVTLCQECHNLTKKRGYISND